MVPHEKDGESLNFSLRKARHSHLNAAVHGESLGPVKRRWGAADWKNPILFLLHAWFISGAGLWVWTIDFRNDDSTPSLLRL